MKKVKTLVERYSLPQLLNMRRDLENWNWTVMPLDLEEGILKVKAKHIDKAIRKLQEEVPENTKDPFLLTVLRESVKNAVKVSKLSPPDIDKHVRMILTELTQTNSDTYSSVGCYVALDTAVDIKSRLESLGLKEVNFTVAYPRYIWTFHIPEGLL